MMKREQRHIYVHHCRFSAVCPVWRISKIPKVPTFKNLSINAQYIVGNCACVHPGEGVKCQVWDSALNTTASDQKIQCIIIIIIIVFFNCMRNFEELHQLRLRIHTSSVCSSDTSEFCLSVKWIQRLVNVHSVTPCTTQPTLKARAVEMSQLKWQRRYLSLHIYQRLLTRMHMQSTYHLRTALYTTHVSS